MKTRLLNILSVLGMMLLALPAFSQVVYKEYPFSFNHSGRPDRTSYLATPVVNVDLDADGVTEFSILSGTSYAGGSGVTYSSSESSLRFHMTSPFGEPVPATFKQCLTNTGSTNFYVESHHVFSYTINYNMLNDHSSPNNNLDFFYPDFPSSNDRPITITSRDVFSTSGYFMVDNTKLNYYQHGFIAFGFNGEAYLNDNKGCTSIINTDDYVQQMLPYYFPFRIKMKDNLYHYGWLQITYGNTLRIAYEATPGAPILVGQTGPLIHCPNLASIVPERAQPVICKFASGSNENLILRAPAGSGYTYHWRHNGINKGYNGDGYLASSVGNYDVIVFDPNTNCIDTSSVLNVFESTAPVVNAGKDTTICEGSSVRLEPVVSGLGPFTYKWENGLSSNISFTDPTQKNQDILPTKYSSVKITAFDSYGCQNNDIVYINLSSKSPITLTTSGTICPPSTLNKVTLAILPNNLYHWYKNDKPLSSIKSSNIQTNTPGRILCCSQQ